MQNPKNQNNKNVVKRPHVQRQMTPKQEQVLWNAFISHLKIQVR